MKTVVVSIGGSVILSDEADAFFLKKLTTLFKKISYEYKLYVIVGGGNIARRYIQLGRDLGFDEDTLDLIGIDVTRVNARIITNLLEISNKEIPHITNEAIKLNFPIVVMGGTDPKHSTDLVGASVYWDTYRCPRDLPHLVIILFRLILAKILIHLVCYHFISLFYPKK